jgi:D-glycero-alpha-D-manno-heptose-7-phosphate kinase
VNRINFMQNGDFSIHPMTLSPERLKELNSYLMLFYTGIKRTASNIASSYAASTDGRTAVLHKMRHCVDQSCEILNGKGDLIPFGELLHEAWLAKRELSDKVSNSQVDSLYDEARMAGAIGGKLLGAGGGGFFLLFVPPEKQNKIRKQLNRLIHVPFEFEFTGSQIIFYDLEEDYSKHDKTRAQQQIESFRELNPDVY